MTEKSSEKQLGIRELGIGLRDRREALGETQASIANDVGMDDKHLGKIERGEKEAGSYLLTLITRRLGFDFNAFSDEMYNTVKANRDDK